MQAVDGQLGPDVAAHLHPAAVGQAHVEDGHVGAERRDPAERLGDGAGLPHHLEVVGRLEQGPQAGPDDLVVVEEEDADGHRAPFEHAGGTDPSAEGAPGGRRNLVGVGDDRGAQEGGVRRHRGPGQAAPGARGHAPARVEPRTSATCSTTSSPRPGRWPTPATARSACSTSRAARPSSSSSPASSPRTRCASCEGPLPDGQGGPRGAHHRPAADPDRRRSPTTPPASGSRPGTRP